MINANLYFNRVKHINTRILEKYNTGVLTLYAGYAGKTGVGSELVLFFDDPEQIQILVNALMDLFLKMSAKTQAEQSDPNSADGIKPILLEQAE